MRPKAANVCGLKLLVYEALSYWCMAFRYKCLKLKLLVYEDFRY